MWKTAEYANDPRNSGEPAVLNKHLAMAPMVPRTRFVTYRFDLECIRK